MRLGASVVSVGVFAGLTFFAAAAPAVGTRVFELDTIDKLSGGDLQGVAIRSDGVVRASWTLGQLSLPPGSGTTALCAAVLADGSVLVGTGPATGGKVVRVENDQATLFADTRESAVNALAVDRSGRVFAATTSGRIYAVSQGKAEVFATLPNAENVFALVADKTGSLYAGTGSGGEVIRVSPTGASSVYFKTDDPFVVSLALDDDGSLYAGTSGKGFLYKITGPGRATVLADLPGEDVHAIALGDHHSVYAIVNEEPPAPSEAEGATSRRATSGGRTPPSPVTAARIKPGKGSLWRIDALGRPERLMHHDEFHYVSLAIDERGTPCVGTGAEGRVYTVDEAHTVALLADTTERQATAIALSARPQFVLTSDPAAFRRVLSVGGSDAVWTSKPLDAGIRAHFGHLEWRGTGHLEVSTRSGDTPAPDSTWSAWSLPVRGGGGVASPSARFIQVRARLKDATSTLADVKLAFVTQNLRAVVTDVVARERSAPGESKEGVPASGGEAPKHESVVHLSWKVDNPDSDLLRYRVQFRHDGQLRWLDALAPDDVLTKAELDWDTATLPEGSYEVRVEASDELANPPTDVTRHAHVSAPILVDNTPPLIRSIAMQGRRLKVDVFDAIGPVSRVEVAVDGKGQWRPLSPDDGIFDTGEEMIDSDVSSLLPTAGPHLLSVRAFDAAGNAVIREVETL